MQPVYAGPVDAKNITVLGGTIFAPTI